MLGLAGKDPSSSGGAAGAGKSPRSKKLSSTPIRVAPKARHVEIPTGPVGVIFDGESCPPRISRVEESSPLKGSLRVDDVVLSVTRPGLEAVTTEQITGRDLVFALNHFKDVPGRGIEVGVPKKDAAKRVILPGAEFEATLPPGRLGVAFVNAAIQKVNADSVLFGKVQVDDVLLAVDGDAPPTQETADVIAFLSEKDDGILHRTLTLRRGDASGRQATQTQNGTFFRLGYVDTKANNGGAGRKLSNFGADGEAENNNALRPPEAVTVDDACMVREIPRAE